MAIHNKRPGGVEARQMADNSTGLDIELDTMPRQDELETYRILFELFDRDMSGFIYVQDVRAIAYKLDRDPNEG